MSTPADQTAQRTRDAERAVLGAVLVTPDAFDAAAEHISDGDFALPEHAALWRVFAALRAAGRPIDTALVADALPREPNAPAASYAFSLIDGVPKASNAGYYAEKVREYAVTRGLRRIAQTLVDKADAADDGPDALLDLAERECFRLRDRSTRVDVLTGARRATDAYAQIQALAEGKGAMGTPTGLLDLDRQTRGLQPGDLVVLAARPSMGKSALMLTMAAAAGATGLPALVFSLEMSAAQLNLREVSMRARVDSWRLQSGKLHQADYSRINTAIEEMQAGGVHVIDSPSATVGQIRAVSRRAKSAHGLSLIAIDYLQLISPERVKGQRTADTRTLEIGEMTRALKGLARDVDTPVLLLSQLSRGVETRTDKRPMLSDLRDSGSIEQDADVVLFIYRPWVYDKREVESEAEIIVAKQRNGPTGPVRALFIKEHTRFVDAARMEGVA
jgi:replicative DNA helicase